ncbi:MAG: zf-HC2 domain-containing protein [Candidatus Contendobacter sp.]
MNTSMTDPPILDLAHNEIEELLPWYANGTLTVAEKATVEQHLDYCLTCRMNLKQCDAFATLVHQPDEETWRPPAGHFNRLMAEIDRLAIPPASIQSAKARPSLLQQMMDWLWATPSPVRWTLAFESLAVAALAAAVWLPMSPTAETSYETLSRGEGHPTVTAIQARVVFADLLTVGDLQTLLDKIGGQLVAGPSVLGVYTVALAPGDSTPATALSHALAVLRAHPQVRLAEPLPEVKTM